MVYETDYFTSLLYERLCWVRLIAVLKYGFKPIEDKQREKQILARVEAQCLNKNCSKKLTNIFLEFFKFNISLAKYVQELYFLKWQTLSGAEFLIIRQEANAMLENEGQEKVDALQLARKSVDEIDQKVFEEMHKITLIAFRGSYEKS